jgi:hypothetical protein
MAKRAVGVFLVLLFASQTAFAQDIGAVRERQNFRNTQSRVETGETLDAGVARLAAKAAFSPSPPPSQQELLDILLFISLRDRQGHGA